MKYRAIKHYADKNEFEIFKKLCEDYERKFATKFSISEVKDAQKISPGKEFNDYSSVPDFNKGKRIN